MYRFLATLTPKKLQEGFEKLIGYSTVSMNSEKFLGFSIVFGPLLAITISLYAKIFLKVPLLIGFVIMLALFYASIYFFLVLKSDAKAKFVDKILPDVLQLMASNLRAGFTTDKAFLLSARPEFGPFQKEINNVGKEITTGKEIDHALMGMTKRIRSEKLSKTIALINSGIKSGGELASLLEQTGKNLRQEEMIDSRIRASVMMYVIFIFSAVCFGSPLLFGLSSFLVGIITTNIASIDIPKEAAGSMPISFSDVAISTDFVILFSVVFLITSSIMGSFIIGLISKGKEREGIRYIPILIALSLAVFFIVRKGIGSMLGGLF
jgi:archaeal flagellar protein FlaJ